MLVDLSGGSAAEVKTKVDALQATPHKDRFRVFANVEWEGAGGPGWEQKVLTDLRQAVDERRHRSEGLQRARPPPQEG